MTTASVETDQETVAYPVPDWAERLAASAPGFLRELPGRPNARSEARIAAAVAAAGEAETDWDLARRRILASLLADGQYAAGEIMSVSFWYRRRAFGLLDGVATALYNDDMQAIAELGDDRFSLPVDTFSSWSRSAILAVDAAADGDVALTVEHVLSAVREKCADARGPGAAGAVALLASAWVAEVVERSLDFAMVPVEHRADVA